MYPLTPLKAELIPLAKHTEGLGNEEVDYKLSLSLFSESVEQNTLDTKTTTSARQERHKKRQAVSLVFSGRSPRFSCLLWCSYICFKVACRCKCTVHVAGASLGQKKKATAINSFDFHVSFKPAFKSKGHLDAHLRSFLIGSIFKRAPGCSSK